MSSIQDTEFTETIREMIAQQGETWAQTSFTFSGEPIDRSSELQAVVIAPSPDLCYRLTLAPGADEWTTREDILRSDEIGKFFAAFGSHWNVLIGSLITVGGSNDDKLMRVRAFIKNGRKAGQEWSISLGEVELNLGYDPAAHAANMQWLKEREVECAAQPAKESDPSAAIRQAGVLAHSKGG